MQNIVLRIATVYILDTNIQHHYNEVNILPLHTHARARLKHHTSQICEKSHKSHNILETQSTLAKHTTTRQKKQNCIQLLQRHRHIHHNIKRVTLPHIKQNMKRIHTTAVTAHLSTRNINRLIHTIALSINTSGTSQTV